MSIFRVGFNRDGRRPVPAAAAAFRTLGLGAAPPGPAAEGPETGPSRQIGGRVRRHRPETGAPARRRERPLAAGLLAAALALPFALSLSPATQADVLLSNLTESADSNLTVGTSGSSQFTHAIRFETGSNEGGYTLTSVKAVLGNASSADGVRVRIFSNSGGSPGSSLHTLTNPTIGNGTREFTAPANTTLAKSTRFFVVFDSTASGQSYQVRGTDSDSLTSMAAGWSLHTSRHTKSSDTGSWSTFTAVRASRSTAPPSPPPPPTRR